MKQVTRRWAGLGVVVAITAAGSGIALAALPSAAAAKSHKPLTRAQVISLIKKYSRPGPRGATGPSGAPGAPGAMGNVGAPGTNYSVGTDSGLTLTGNALSVDSGLLGECPMFQVLYSLSASGGGSRGCEYPLTPGFEAAGFSATAGVASGSIPLMVSGYQEIASVSASAPGPSDTPYYVNGQVDLFSSSTATVNCSLFDNETFLETESTEVTGSNTLDLQALPTVASGDTLTLSCIVVTEGPDVSAAGSLVDFPVG